LSGRGPKLLLGICKHLGASIYLSGAFGREYLNIAEVAAEGVQVRLHEYHYPVYAQGYDGFVPFLSYLICFSTSAWNASQWWLVGH
jgi:hypothetical protein